MGRSDGQKTILKWECLPFILRFTLLPLRNHYLSVPPPPMASIQFIRLLSSLIGSSIESWRGRRDGDHSRENIGGVILLVGILIPRIYRTKIIKIVRVGLDGIDATRQTVVAKCVGEKGGKEPCESTDKSTSSRLDWMCCSNFYGRLLMCSRKPVSLITKRWAGRQLGYPPNHTTHFAIQA